MRRSNRESWKVWHASPPLPNQPQPCSAGRPKPLRPSASLYPGGPPPSWSVGPSAHCHRLCTTPTHIKSPGSQYDTGTSVALRAFWVLRVSYGEPFQCLYKAMVYQLLESWYTVQPKILGVANFQINVKPLLHKILKFKFSKFTCSKFEFLKFKFLETWTGA